MDRARSPVLSARSRVGLFAAAFVLIVLAGSHSAGPRTTASSIALSADTWTPIGPAPTVNGLTDYADAASGRVVGLAADPSDSNIAFPAPAGGGTWTTTHPAARCRAWTDTQHTPFMVAAPVRPTPSSPPQVASP